MHVRVLTLALTSYLFIGRALTDSVMVGTATDFMNIVDKVNSGSSYFGTTIYLSADLDFTGKTYTPMAPEATRNFQGTIDGKGYTIKNLVMTTNPDYGGLIGYSHGTNISNLVMDSSCSFNLTGRLHFLGLISTVYTTHPTIIKNVINMADMIQTCSSITQWTISGSITGIVYLEGYDFTVRNCVNYGTVTDKAPSTAWSEIGGLVGDCHNSNSSKCYFQNCVNYGTVKQVDGSVAYVAIGGIIGICNGVCHIDNCVNFGTLSYSNGIGYRGGIIGFLDGTSSIFNNNYWSTSSVDKLFGVKQNSYNKISNCVGFDPRTYLLSNEIFIGSYAGMSLIDALTAGVKLHTLHEYSPWVLNPDSKTVTTYVDGRKIFSLAYNLVLLPSFASDAGTMFYGWYSNSRYTTIYTETSTLADLALYGKLQTNSNKYTIKFESRGGSASTSITAAFGSTVTLPTPTKSNCDFLWWESIHGDIFQGSFIVIAQDITLYAVWACTRISTIDDMTMYSKAVRWDDDSVFNGKTVYLDADLDFSGRSDEFTPIENSKSTTFDGQGHIISNLTIAEPHPFVGMFSAAYYMTVRNLVFDSTCNVTSSYQCNNYDDELAVGMAVGYAYLSTIENIVNMGTPYNQRTVGILYLGGIVGTAGGYASVRNCVNYGYLLNTGYFSTGNIGGVIGSYETSLTNSGVFVYNCANYGMILQEASSNGWIGGIVGYTCNLYYIDNCISGGVISIKYDNGIGAIIGYASTSLTLSYNKWTTDVWYDVYGNSSNIVLRNTTVSVLPVDDIALMNNRSIEKGWNQWISIHLGGGHFNGTLQDNAVSTQKHLPEPTREGCTFLGYYKNSDYTEIYDPRSIDNVTDIYAKWEYNPYTMTHIFDNGTVLKRVLKYTDSLTHPNDTKEGYTLKEWCSDDGTVCSPATVPPRDTTFHEVWNANIYTISFDLGNGTVIKKALRFGETIIYPEGIERGGYVFDGWNSNTTNMPCYDFTINALWTEILGYVEIVFATEGLKEEEIRDIISKYVSSTEYEIKILEITDQGLKVIIQFFDIKESEEFVRKIKMSSDSNEDIKEVNFVTSFGVSFSLISSHILWALYYIPVLFFNCQ